MLCYDRAASFLFEIFSDRRTQQAKNGVTMDDMQNKFQRRAEPSADIDDK